MPEEKAGCGLPMARELRRELMHAERSPREIVEQLLEDCRASEVVEPARNEKAIGAPPWRSYQPVFQRVLADIPRRARELARSSAAAEDDLHLLLETDAAGRESLLQGAPHRFRSPTLVDLLIRHSQLLLASRPEEALDLAQCAHDVSLRLLQPEIGRGWAMTSIARATAHLGNALRVGGDLERAERMLEFALGLFDRQGTGDCLLEAEIFLLTAQLHSAQRRFIEAESCFSLVRGLCEECEAFEEIGPVLIEEAAVLAAANETDTAVETAETALLHLDPQAEPCLHLCARQNLAYYLLAAGRREEALSALDDGAAGLALRLDRWFETRRQWLTARALEPAQPSEAAAADDAALRGCAELGLDLDHAEGPPISDLEFGFRVLKLGQGLEAQPWDEPRLSLAHPTDRPSSALTCALFIPQPSGTESRSLVAN